MMKAAGSVNGQSTGGPSRWYSFPGMTKEATPAREPQSAGAVLMVRPAGFAFNSIAKSCRLLMATEG